MFSYLLIINLYIIMFKASLGPLTPFFCTFHIMGSCFTRFFKNVTSMYGDGLVCSTQQNESYLMKISKTLHF